MNEINGNPNALFNDLSLTKNQEDKKESGELGQNAFLKLMITQMENQSPLEPQDNTQFISQLAQFSSVESLDKLNNNFDSFANSFVSNQALQASTLVGRSVTVPANETRLEASGVVSLTAEVPTSSSDINLSIYSEKGVLVDTMSLGSHPKGDLLLRWDGASAELNGQLLDWKTSHPEGQPPGNYRFELSSRVDGVETALDTALSANVNSVTVASDGTLSLNLAGIGSVKLSDVKQFNQ